MVTNPDWRPEPVDPYAAEQVPPATGQFAVVVPADLPLPVYPGPDYTSVPAQFDDAPLVSIGDITVSRNSVIVPQGRFPLRGSTWTVQDSIQVTESIPVWAIIMTILFVWFCLIGLLFLLAKEKRYNGFVAVTVVGDGLYHSVQFPAGPTVAGWVTTQGPGKVA